MACSRLIVFDCAGERNGSNINKGNTTNNLLPKDFFFLSSSKTAYKTGSTIKVSIVAVIKPPTTTVARGLWTSAPAEVERAIGRNPNAAADAVNKTGLKIGRAHV